MSPSTPGSGERAGLGLRSPQLQRRHSAWGAGWGQGNVPAPPSREERCVLGGALLAPQGNIPMLQTNGNRCPETAPGSEIPFHPLRADKPGLHT